MGPLLLDTHVFLWWRMNAPDLTEEARHAVARADTVLVSAASAWEAAIKVALGRLTLPEPFARGVEGSAFVKLAITFAHADRVGHLPHHHGDPFDRLLVAQAQVEELTLVTHDRKLEPYDVDVLWT